LGNKQWNIPKLKKLLKNILPQKSEITDYKVLYTFKDIGRKIILLNAKQIIHKGSEEKLILFAIEDITAQKDAQEKLKVTNQQLDASNQRLRASEQQFRATNQQLEANNQQLIATEQQLRAANQQLIASENSLKIEKEFSEDLLETANTFIVVLDVNANITLFNKFAERLTGYKKNDVLGKNWFDLFIPKQNGNTIPKVFQKAIKEMPEVSSYENPVLCKHGPEKLISWKNTVLKDETGKISGILSIGIDITERKKADELLKKNERFLNTVLDSVQDGISVLDPDLTIQHVNGTMNKWYEQNLPLEGKICHEVYHNANKPCNPCPTLRCLKSGVAEKNIIRGLPGSPVEWLELFSYPIKEPNSDKVTAVVEFVRDISGRIKTENALKMNEENFRSLVENSFDGIMINNITGRYLYANGKAGEISGYSIKELLKLNVKDLTPSEDEDKIMKQIKVRLENDQVPNYFESILICKDGKKIPIGLTVSPTVWENRPAEIVSMRDISERKRAEKVLKKKMNELEIFNEVTVDREIKINELRKEINELLEKTGQKAKYEIVE
ncbi:MAG: PAS domain S-box protein, partial [Candidatus Marinimicrobia bacterium]|nr:PAS domain S-box protein [Candidatus Neomarinimicrobiota bacterium]